MGKRFLWVTLAGLLVCLAVTSNSAQTNPKPVELSIAVDNVAIDPHHRIKVRVRIANHTGRTFKRNVATLEFHLEKKLKAFKDCTRGDCFVTSTFWMKKFDSDGTYEFTVDLTKFYWNDAVASTFDMSRPKNMRGVILPDDYSLFLSFWADIPATKDEKAFHVEGKSNAVAVKVERRK